MLTRHGRYRYVPITQRPSYRWPNGTGLAVYLALGVEEYAFGQGMTEDLLPGASKPDMANTSWRDYGNRVGCFRLLDRLSALGIAPALLLNTALYDHAPEVVEAARAAKAEIVAHGYSNSDTLATMSPAEEADYIGAVVRRIAAEEGSSPGGWSSPWLAHTDRTLELLTAAGCRYLLDLGMDDQPVWLSAGSERLLAVPYALELNDSSTIIGRQASADEFARMIVDEFDEMFAAARTQPLVMSIVVHSFISGRPFRLRALTRALDHILRHREQVWITTPGEIARFIDAEPDRAV